MKNNEIDFTDGRGRRQGQLSENTSCLSDKPVNSYSGVECASLFDL